VNIERQPGPCHALTGKGNRNGVMFKPGSVKGFILLFLSVFAVHSFPAAAFDQPAVLVNVTHSQDLYRAGGTYSLQLNLHIPHDWYIYGPGRNEPGSPLKNTSISFEKASGITIGDIRFPDPVPVKTPFQKEPILLFEGTVPVRVTLDVDPAAPSGEYLVKGRLSYQACTTTACMPPSDTPIEVRLDVVSLGPSTHGEKRDMVPAAFSSPAASAPVPGPKAGSGLLLTLTALFLGGLALNLTPCIYPLIPITVSYFGGAAGASRGRTLIHGALYLGGLAVTNSALGVAAALSGGMLGAALQSDWVLILVSTVLLTMGLSFFGLWELRLPAALSRLASRRAGGYAGSAFMGLTLGVVAAPCIGPFILGLLAYVAQKGDPVTGFVYFFVLSLGMGLPLAALGFFSRAIERLPGSGDWMVWVRKVMGWVLVAMAGYMVLPVLPGDFAAGRLLSALAVAAGLHLGWIDRSGRSNPGFLKFRKAAGLLLAAAGLIFFMRAGADRGEPVSWTPYTPGVLRQAAADGMPVMLDFSADWCMPCREMDERVFSHPGVVEASRRFHAIRVDLTDRNPERERVRQRFYVRGVPTVIFLDHLGREILSLRVESYVPPSIFLDLMEQALESGGIPSKGVPSAMVGPQSPSNQGGPPGQAPSEDRHAHQMAPLYASVADRLVQGDGAGGR
jgi:thioredoxin:protein disulfide reductase